MAEPVCAKFITVVLKVWNETVALDKEPGKYKSIARRKDREWYVGAMTNWGDQKFQIDLSFLPNGLTKPKFLKME